jgi:hypothetical protein
MTPEHIEPHFHLLPPMPGNLGSKPSFAIKAATQNFSSPSYDYVSRFRWKSLRENSSVKEFLQGFVIQVYNISGSLPKTKTGGGRLPHGRPHSNKGDPRGLNSQLLQELFQPRSILDRPDRASLFEKAEVVESSFRNPEPLFKVSEDFFSISLAYEGEQ